MPQVRERIKNVEIFRLASSKVPTQKLAEFPTLFAEIRQPKTDYIVIPLHSSENRTYIPMGFFSKDYIVNNSISIVPTSSRFHFAILISLMHMIWVKYICGRIKSDYRYSNKLVYNNYPFPKDVSDKNRTTVEEKAQNILEIRTEFTDSSLADLYDPLAMPPKLKKAHQELDRAVDKCYTKRTFKSDKERIEFLFGLYEEYVDC